MNRLKKMAEGILNYHELMMNLSDKVSEIAKVTTIDKGYESEEGERAVMYTSNGDGYPGSPGYELYYATVSIELTKDNVERILNVTFDDVQWEEFTNEVLDDCYNDDNSEFLKEIESYNGLFSDALEGSFDSVKEEEISCEPSDCHADENTLKIVVEFNQTGYDNEPEPPEDF